MKTDGENVPVDVLSPPRRSERPSFYFSQDHDDERHRKPVRNLSPF